MKILENKTIAKNKLRFQVLARDGFHCRYCGSTPANGVKLVIDHIVPLKEGGTWDLNNLITACEPCNLGKGRLLLLGKNQQIPTFLAISALASDQKSKSI